MTSSLTNKQPPAKGSTGAKRQTREWWLAHYQHWLASGLTKAAFCKQQAISAASFYQWAQKFREEGVTASKSDYSNTPQRQSFIQVTPSKEPVASQRVTSLTVNETTLHFDEGLTMETLPMWLKYLRRAPC